jgi:hypothetical protein
MKLLPLGLFVLAGALPLRAQSLFVVTEEGARYPVKAVDDQGPEIVVHGQLRHSTGGLFSLVKAPIYGLGTVDLRDFKLDISNVASASSTAADVKLHVHGHLRADRAVQHCFFVLRVVSEAGRSVVCHELPDLPPNQDVDYDRFFDLPLHGLPGAGKFETLIFADGLQLTTTRMPPLYVAEQRTKTEEYLKGHAAH